MIVIPDMVLPKRCDECRLLNVIGDYRCMALPAWDEEACMRVAVEDGRRDRRCPLEAGMEAVR